TPWDDDGATLDGEPIGVEAKSELGRRALSTYVSIPPGESRTLVFELSGFLADTEYRLDLASQPLVEPEQASVAISLPGGGAVVSGPVDIQAGEARGTFELERSETIVVRRR